VTSVGSVPVDALPLADLRRVVSALVAQVATLQDAGDQHMAVLALKDAEIAALKDEIARLKGLPSRPKFKVKPSGMEQASKPVDKKGTPARPWLLARQSVGDVGGEAQGGSAAGVTLPRL